MCGQQARQPLRTQSIILPPIPLELTGHREKVHGDGTSSNTTGNGCVTDGRIESAGSVNHHVDVISFCQRGQGYKEDADISGYASNDQLLAPGVLHGSNEAEQLILYKFLCRSGKGTETRRLSTLAAMSDVSYLLCSKCASQGNSLLPWVQSDNIN